MLQLAARSFSQHSFAPVGYTGGPDYVGFFDSILNRPNDGSVLSLPARW